MAFGGLKGTLTGSAASILASNAITGSVVVAVGDLVFVAVAQQTALTANACSDNLGNTYTAQNAGTLSGAIVSGRAYWSRVTVAGTLTTVTVTATASANDFSGLAAVIEGPIVISPLDTNPANITTDITSPFTCPATGALAQAGEIVIAWGAFNTATAWAATSPNLLAANVLGSVNASVAIGYQAVAATTTVTPVFTSAANPTGDVLGTASFKADKPFAAGVSALVFNIPGIPPQRTPRNKLLFTDMPFSLGDWNVTRRVPDFLPPFQVARNSSLFTAVPFSQSDWNVTRRTPDFLPPAQPYNINIFAPNGAETLRAPMLGRLRTPFASFAQYLGTPASLLTVPLSDAPFAQLDWSKPRALNILPPSHQPTNINLFDNPIPFAQFDWSVSRHKPDFLPPSTFYNANIFSEVPFAQLDWSQPRHASDTLPPDTQPYNVNLYGVVTVPFAQLDWPSTRRTPDILPPATFYNTNIFSEVPFTQLDWSQPKRTPDFLPSSQPYNISIFSEVPFAQLVWVPTARGPFTAFTQSYNLTILGDLQGPFNQLSWSTSKVSRSSASDVFQRNVNIFSEVPFYKTDWTTAAVARLTAPIPASYNTGLYATVPAPFIPIDWSRPFKVPAVPAGTPPLNINLFTNPIPFSQSDWSATSRQKPTAVNLQPLNINLYGVIVVAPFYQTDWPSPRRVASAPVDLSKILNLNIYTNPIPFAQYSWTAPSAHVNAPYFVIQDFMLLVSVSPASETPHIVKFIGNVGHMMLR